MELIDCFNLRLESVDDTKAVHQQDSNPRYSDVANNLNQLNQTTIDLRILFKIIILDNVFS